MHRRTPLFALLLMGLIASGCSSSRSTTASDPLADSEQRLNNLEQRIEALTKRMTTAGRGAYADGPALMVDQHGADSLLQRLYDLQAELATTRSRIGQHRVTLEQTRQRLADHQAENEQLKADIFRLQRFEQSVVIAREELADHKDRILTLNQELLDAQRRRLDIERAYAEFTRVVLELEPLHTQRLLDLQQSVRENIEKIWPADAPGHHNDLHVQLQQPQP